MNITSFIFLPLNLKIFTISFLLVDTLTMHGPLTMCGWFVIFTAHSIRRGFLALCNEYIYHKLHIHIYRGIANYIDLWGYLFSLKYTKTNINSQSVWSLGFINLAQNHYAIYGIHFHFTFLVTEPLFWVFFWKFKKLSTSFNCNRDSKEQFHRRRTKYAWTYKHLPAVWS